MGFYTYHITEEGEESESTLNPRYVQSVYTASVKARAKEERLFVFFFHADDTTSSFEQSEVRYNGICCRVEELL